MHDLPKWLQALPFAGPQLELFNKSHIKSENYYRAVRRRRVKLMSCSVHQFSLEHFLFINFAAANG